MAFASPRTRRRRRRVPMTREAVARGVGGGRGAERRAGRRSRGGEPRCRAWPPPREPGPDPGARARGELWRGRDGAREARGEGIATIRSGWREVISRSCGLLAANRPSSSCQHFVSLLGAAFLRLAARPRSPVTSRLKPRGSPLARARVVAMGLYSKGTRSKGVTRPFQKAGQANTLQRSKHTKKEAFLAKEAFMKEPMARHLAAAELAADGATRPGGDDATDRGADAARDVDVGASDRAPPRARRPRPRRRRPPRGSPALPPPPPRRRPRGSSARRWRRTPTCRCPGRCGTRGRNEKPPGAGTARRGTAASGGRRPAASDTS